MKASTLFRFLFGNAEAIRQVASNRLALPVGLLLVLSAGVARNYDQVWFGSTSKWLTGPLLFSMVSGLWIFIFVFTAWKGKLLVPAVPGPGRWSRLGRAILSFYGLFWLTAPLAWLYALPVERWFDEVEAARWNIRLLGIVAVWRVLLFGRVVSVIGKLPYVYSLALVLLPACLEALGVTLPEAVLGRNMMASMAGLRSSPAEEVLQKAYGNVAGIAFLLGGAALAVVIFYSQRTPTKDRLPWQPVETARSGPLLWVFLLMVAAFWAVVSIGPQKEQRLNYEVEALAKNGDWQGMAAILSAHGKTEFAPGRLLPPGRYEMDSFKEHSKVLEHLRPDTSQWVREYYLERLELLLSMKEYRQRFEYDDVLRTVTALERLDEGPALVRRNLPNFEESLGQLQGTYGWMDEIGQRLQKLAHRAVVPAP